MFKLAEATPYILFLFGIILTLIGASIRSLLSSINNSFKEIKDAVRVQGEKIQTIETKTALLDHRVAELEKK